MRLRGDWQDGDIDIEEDFYILRHTMCPAVLSEIGFMTNEKECRWLQTEEALAALTKTHVEGIAEYLKDGKKYREFPTKINVIGKLQGRYMIHLGDYLFHLFLEST